MSTSGYPVPQGAGWFKEQIRKLRARVDEVRSLAQKAMSAANTANGRLGSLGLVLLRPAPSQLVNCSIDADGVITLNATDNDWCEIRGVFTDQYRAYRIEFVVGGATSNGFIFRLMSGTTMLSGGTDYGNSTVYMTTAGVLTPAYASQSYGRLFAVASTGKQVGTADISAPTRGDVITSATFQAMSSGVYNEGGMVYAPGGVQDGIALQRGPASAPKTTEGSVKIYGYA